MKVKVLLCHDWSFFDHNLSVPFSRDHNIVKCSFFNDRHLGTFENFLISACVTIQSLPVFVNSKVTWLLFT